MLRKNADGTKTHIDFVEMKFIEKDNKWHMMIRGYFLMDFPNCKNYHKRFPGKGKFKIEITPVGE